MSDHLSQAWILGDLNCNFIIIFISDVLVEFHVERTVFVYFQVTVVQVQKRGYLFPFDEDRFWCFVHIPNILFILGESSFFEAGGGWTLSVVGLCEFISQQEIGVGMMFVFLILNEDFFGD